MNVSARKLFAILSLVAALPLARAETLREAVSQPAAVLFGAAISGGAVGGRDFDNTARVHLSVASPENDLKMAGLRPTQASFNWTAGDKTVNWAHAAGQQVRGHALLWHGSVPTWVSSGGFTAAQLQDILYTHIDTVAAHYRGDVFCWDVVNEAFNDNGTLRSTIWYDTPGIGYAGMGTRYIEEAFRRAAAADPDAQLIYNDYSNESVNTKSTAIYTMCQDFLDMSRVNGPVPLHGVGFQMHVTPTSVNYSSMRTNFQRFGALGLNLQITELDVRIPVDASGNATAADLAAQAEAYWNILGVALAIPQMKVVQPWGFTDAYSWIPGFFAGFGAALPFDTAYQKKPAYWAIWNAFANQGEKLAVAAASDPLDTVADPLCSAGSARRLLANAAGDFATFTVNVPNPGSWNVRVGLRRSADSGQVQCAVAPPTGSFTNLSTVKDSYASTAASVDFDLGNVTFATNGSASFRCTVTGKNAASSGYRVAVDYIRITPVAGNGDTPPTITSIADQTLRPSFSSPPLTFTVGDAETAAGSLTVTAESLNPAVLPNANLTLGGTGASRTLSIAAPVVTTGAAAVVLKVSDGSTDTYETLLVTVGENGDFETGTTTNWSGAGGGGTLNVVASPVHAGSYAGALTGRTQTYHGSGQSFAAQMVGGVTYYVSGWVRVGNAASATAKITAHIVDGTSDRYLALVSGTATNTGWLRLAAYYTPTLAAPVTTHFLYFEGPPSGVDMFIDDFRVVPNTPPTLADIADQTIVKNSTTGALNFTVDDAQTGASAVTLSATSSNISLVPNASVVLGGSGANRTVTVTPLANQTGVTTITITASDSKITTSQTFTVTVLSALEDWRFTNFGTIANSGSAADDLDPDFDGLKNLLEFFLNDSPNTATVSRLPVAARESTDLTLTYTRLKAALNEVTYRVEWSDTLSAWSTAGVTEQILSDNGVEQQVKARVAIGTSKTKYLHLKVSRP